MMLPLIDYVKSLASNIRGLLDMLFVAPVFPPKLSDALERLQYTGHTVLVTGANAGMGKEIALWFASHGAAVYMLCRNDEKATEAMNEIRGRSGNAEVFVELVDFASLDSVREFVSRWAQRAGQAKKIDILMNNAATTNATKVTTVDGFELTYQTNFLSPFLLVTELLHRDCFTPNARIIQTSSHALYIPNRPDPSKLNSEDFLGGREEGWKMSYYQSFTVYGRTKAMLAMWTRDLQERLAKTEQGKDIVVQCCNPGWVSTGIWYDYSGFAAYRVWHKFMVVFDAIIGIKNTQGAVMPLFLATSAEAAQRGVRGSYWDMFRLKWTPAWIGDDRLSKAFWTKWEEDAGTEASF